MRHGVALACGVGMSWGGVGMSWRDVGMSWGGAAGPLSVVLSPVPGGAVPTQRAAAPSWSA